MMKADWVRDVRDRCRENDIPFFFKHWGTNETSKAFESLNGERKIDGREWKQVPEMPRSPFAKDNPHSHGGGRVRK
jgi:protein gp37